MNIAFMGDKVRYSLFNDFLIFNFFTASGVGVRGQTDEVRPGINRSEPA